MSSKMQITNVTNDWVEEAISKKFIKYYEYKDFQNIEEISNDELGKIYRTNWKNLKQYFVLKSFDLDNIFIKRIIQKLKLHQEVNFLKNIILSFGITYKENHNYQLNEYLLVMEFVDNQKCLKEIFKNFNWEDRMTEEFQTNINYNLKSDYVDFTSMNNLLYGKSSQFIQNFDKINIKEEKPTTQGISKNIFEEDLNIIVDELVNLYFKELNIGKEVITRKKVVLDYFNDHHINLQEIYYWLLNNQTDSNSICLLGYFNYHGMGINTDKQIAFELYQKASELENFVAQYYLIYMYMVGRDIDKNYDKAFKMSRRLSERKYPCGINMLAYCYEYGIGTSINAYRTFELFQKTAGLGNVIGINRLGRCYENGIGTEVNELKAFELYQKAADLGNIEAADLDNAVAQYNLALIYEYGKGVEKNVDKAIHWYKISANQGYTDAQDKLNELLKK
ncbi:kinase-like domain-containing protein [Rhizophagus clarus]|uniref:Kinase-like domain-containing protein n=1 Tax=Rhizophagus clarus TaxID=94130 RepID=A0A8H3LR63_9GLOM|nr:kinase-like domain-containing protein [Rhizophagus clarus]